MREILFRGKRTSYPYEGWAEGSLLCVDGHCMILEKENDDNGYCYPYINAEDGIVDGGLTTVDPETMGQYTGLKDKNGRRIFEGDIVKVKHSYAGNPNYPTAEYIEVVEYDARSCCYEFYRWSGDIYDVEVIGNIHDNPEMLKGENTNG